MKRRVICLCLGLLLFLTACQPRPAKTGGEGFQFYYPTASYDAGGAICAQTANVEPESLTLQQLVQAYLTSVPPEHAGSPVPTGWRLETAQLQNATAALTFSGSRASALERSLAATCLTLTLLQLEGVQRISLTTPESNEPLLLSENDVSLHDTGMLPQEEKVTLYYPDDARHYLLRETQTVEAMEPEEKPAYIMQQLLSARERGLLTSCIPEGTELLSIHVEGGVCTVNLSADFLNRFERSFSAERMAVYAIVNSLTELPEITTVDLWVSGAPLESLYRMKLSNGVARDESLLAIPSSKELVDISLYPTCGTDGMLVEIPMMLQLEPERELAAAVMDALIRYEGKNGLQGCIPEGTKLLSLRMEGTACTIDLTGEFIDGCANDEAERLAVHSVVATLCSLPEITTVEILVEGIAPVFRDETLGGVQQVRSAWISE